MTTPRAVAAICMSLLPLTAAIAGGAPAIIIIGLLLLVLLVLVRTSMLRK